MPATPSATSTMPKRHGRPNESLTITATSMPSSSRQAGAQGRGRRVGVPGQQGHEVGSSAVRGVDAGIGADVAVMGPADDQAALEAKNFGRLTQHHLDLPCVALPRLGELNGLRPRLDGAQVDQLAFGLGHDLLGDHEDITRAAAPIPARRWPGRARRRRSARRDRRRALSPATPAGRMAARRPTFRR